jgi:sugar lactone lactonase YvrE
MMPVAMNRGSRLFLALVLFAGTLPGQSPAYSIDTFAGSYTLGDGGPATSALLLFPNVALPDGNGNVYIADVANALIRKVTPDGVISTVAGTGQPGYSGDGGLATAAQLQDPNGLARDAAGNLYIADSANNVVRIVTPDGTITTFAGTGAPGSGGDGGPASSAGLSAPIALCLDAAGNLFIADYYNNRVRRVGADGVITTVAGTGVAGYSGDGAAATSALINAPSSLAMDAGGNLFIGEGNQVRRVDAAGIISTVAGNGTAGFSGDGGPATSAQMSPQAIYVDANGTLYIADGNRIRTVTAGIINTIAGTGDPGFAGDGGPAASALLNFPAGLWVDSAGSLLIADSLNNLVRTIDSTGIITTSAGAPHFAGDGGPARSALLQNPSGVAVDVQGNVYIADTSNNRVRMVEASTGNLATMAGSDFAGYSGDDGPATSAQLFGPVAVATDATGALYISDGGDIGIFLGPSPGYRVRTVSPSGTIRTLAGGADQASVSPLGLAIDANGNTYFADQANHRIRKVTASGVISTLAGSGVRGFSGDGGDAAAAKMTQPSGVAVDTAGNLYIADTGNNCVRKVTTGGVISTIAGSGTTAGFSGDGGPAKSALLSGPQAVAVDSAGNVYIADTANHSVRKVSTDGVITTVAGAGVPGFSGDTGPATDARLNVPTALAVDANGNVYVADSLNQRIRILSPQAQ